MKPVLTPPEVAPLIVFGAHPDDIEFGCGAIVARDGRVQVAGFERDEDASRAGRGVESA